jgi:hypothetical protein
MRLNFIRRRPVAGFVTIALLLAFAIDGESASA